MSQFSVSQLAAALKAVNDAGEALMQQCDGKDSADLDIEPLKDGLVAIWNAVAPRATDVELSGSKQRPDQGGFHGNKDGEIKRGSQEVARGDKHVAQDSRLRVTPRPYDSRSAGAGSVWAGVSGDLTPSRHLPFSVDGVFGGSGSGGDVSSHSIDSIFKPAPKLAEG